MPGDLRRFLRRLVVVWLGVGDGGGYIDNAEGVRGGNGGWRGDGGAA